MVLVNVNTEKLDYSFVDETITVYETYLELEKNNLPYIDFYFSFESNNIRKLDFFNKYFRINKPMMFEDISGIIQLNKLEYLKITLRSSLYIDSITKLNKLKELHLSGNISRLPNFQTSLKKLYLYNLPVNDFSFLNNSNINYLLIVTRDYNNKKWNKLKKKYPNINIIVKNKLFSPLKVTELRVKTFFNNKKGIETDNNKLLLDFDGIFLRTNKYEILKELRNKILTFVPSLANVIFLIDEIGINVNTVWNKNITLLDKALEHNYFLTAGYLVYNGGKRFCRLKGIRCKSDDKFKKIRKWQFIR